MFKKFEKELRQRIIIIAKASFLNISCYIHPGAIGTTSCVNSLSND